ncbi:MAG: restriction endonuclease subunit S [Cyclobacteriaceae bacterium]
MSEVQEIKEGYKESPLGLIPEDWEVDELGNRLNKIVGGGTPTRGNAAYWINDIPWATVKDLKKERISHVEEYISKEGLNQSASNLIEKGTLIIATRMALGKAVFFEMDVAINQDLKAIYPDPSIGNEFLRYWFYSQVTKIQELGSGSTVKGIRLEVLRKLQLIVPPLPEQKIIADILTAVDDKIEAIDQRIKATQTLKKGLMQRLLTKGINHTEFKDSPLAEIPKSWEVLCIDDACEIHNNLREPISAEMRKGMQGEYPYYGPTKAVDYINKYSLEGDYVLIGEDGDHFLKFKTWSMTQLVSGKFNVNNHAHILKGTSICLTEWIHFYFQHRDLFNFLTRQGAGRYKLTKASLLKIMLAIPPVSEQKQIAEILTSVDDKLDALREKKSTYQELKKGLMQQLLTGKKRVKI